MLLMGVIIFGTTQFIPQLLQEVLGYTATDAGPGADHGRPRHAARHAGRRLPDRPGRSALS